MPKSFVKCVKKGGRVVTLKPNARTYLKVCYRGGKSYRGETHHVKKAEKAKK